MGDLAALLSSPVAVVAAGIFGAIWGSFLNVCIARVPLGQSVVRPGSHCFACGKPVHAWDNLPILSYFILRGRCRACGAPFSIRYVLVEALTAALSALLFWQLVASDAEAILAVRLARYCVTFAFSAALIVLSFIDFDTKTLPDVITLPSIPILFLAGFAVHDAPWKERAIGAVGGYLFIWILVELYYLIRKREGMGLGDAKLLAMMGALLGWKALPFIVFTANVAGIVVSLPLLVWQRRRPPASPDEAEPPLAHVQIPFGPFLSLGAIVYILLSGPLWRLFRTWVLGG